MLPMPPIGNVPSKDKRLGLQANEAVRSMGQQVQRCSRWHYLLTTRRMTFGAIKAFLMLTQRIQVSLKTRLNCHSLQSLSAVYEMSPKLPAGNVAAAQYFLAIGMSCSVVHTFVSGS